MLSLIMMSCLTECDQQLYDKKALWSRAQSQIENITAKFYTSENLRTHVTQYKYNERNNKPVIPKINLVKTDDIIMVVVF